MNTIGVALCEDNEDFRESLVQFIGETPGFTVVAAASNATQLLQQIQGDQPHIVLMDIDMPGMDGIRATRLVKQRFPDVEVLILTVFEDDDKIFSSILAGASGYLLKKSPAQKIIHAIEEVMDGGGSMSGSVVKKVLNYFNEKAPVPNDYMLSEREKNILECLVAGDSYKMIGDHCNISIGTVCTHINNIYKKLHINSKSEAVAKALREKLI